MKAKKEEGLLDSLCIAAPCSFSWESMKGDNRKRQCSGCSSTVFNISDMTKGEAERFLRENSGAPPCMTFYRRHDGTIMTDNCPVGLRKLRDQCKALVRMASALVAFLLSWTAVASAQSAKDLHQSSSFARSAPGLLPTGGEPLPMLPGYVRGKTVAPTSVQSGTIANPVTTAAGKPRLRDFGAPGQIINPRLMGGDAPPNNLGGGASRIGADDDNGKVRLRAEYNVYMDRKALELFNKGQSAAAAGNKPLATFYFEKALDAFDQQSKGDRKFRDRIQKALKALE